jgi:membrane protease YdiL (CAAX protease family)
VYLLANYALTTAGGDGVASARRGVLAYLLLVAVLSGAVQALIIGNGQLDLVLVLMWMPALASILVRLARREGFADVSFRFGGRRTWVAILLVILLPYGVGLVAYGLAWATGLATFAPPETVPLLGARPDLAPPARFALRAVTALLTGILPGIALAAGEEIGWRGYLQLRLIDARVPAPILVDGVIWGLWHVPLILAGLYITGPVPLLSAAVFMIVAVSLTVPISWARLATGSVWPAVVAHGAWNTVIQMLFDPSTAGPNHIVWVGESGLLTAATLAVLAVVIARRSWPVMRTPARSDESPASRVLGSAPSAGPGRPAV